MCKLGWMHMICVQSIYQAKNIKKSLGDPWKDAWDSWPAKVWQVAPEGVEFVKNTDCSVSS